MKTERLRRFESHTPIGKRSVVIGRDHPASVNARSIFLKPVRSDPGRALKSGFNSRKIGGKVVKGVWTGMPIFTLTLEERATCPRTCAHWLDCYGNKMHWSTRHAHGLALEAKLDDELRELSAEYRRTGFVVRLHVLGDFYSVAYVRRWEAWLDEVRGLHVFGYTARDPSSDIGAEIQRVRKIYRSRFSIRQSDGAAGFRTLTVTAPETARAAVLCPAQHHPKGPEAADATCCGSCGLCWSTPKPIAFLQH